MKKNIFSIIIGLLLLVGPVMATTDGTTESYRLWLGAHYTDFNDYRKKVGEYNLGDEKVWPEFRVTYLSESSDGIMSVTGHFYDDQDARGRLKTTVGDNFRGIFEYRSMVHQKGQDLLANLEARELVGENPGGKILTHELLDPGADYYTRRKEILTQVNVLLSKKNNVKLIGAHRSIFQNGHEQKLANTHCFSCHISSRTGEVDKTTHEFEVGLQGDVNKVTVGYQFGYRWFESGARPAYAYYDRARHPVNGGSEAEFTSRLIYADTTLPIDAYPKTEKTSHKVRVKSDIGKGQFAGSVAYFRTTNKDVDLTADGWWGALNYAVPLSPRTRFVAKATGLRRWNDNTFVDLPEFRAGRPGTNFPGSLTGFSYTRYSSLDRRTADVSAEIIHRMNPRTTVSVLAGYRQVKRYYYPMIPVASDFTSIAGDWATMADPLTTNTFIAQGKINYRKSSKVSGWAKYHLEISSDPFTVKRGLFEEPGYGVLHPAVGPPPAAVPYFIFYYQREGLRYQDVTTVPTQAHDFELRATLKPESRYTVNVGVRGNYDKNSDLDSLDVNEFFMQPNLSLTFVASQRTALTAGYTYNYRKSRGPVAVALFDG